MTTKKITRICPGSGIELKRAGADESDGHVIEGYALLFNVESTPLWRTNKGLGYEVIAPGAVTQQLLDASDIALTVDHDNSRLLGRSKYGKGNLSYSVDDKGVKFVCRLPDTTDAADTIELIRSGVIDGCSFSAYVKEEASAITEADRINEDGSVDTIITIHAFEAFCDFCVTNIPAYDKTTCKVSRTAPEIAPVTYNSPNQQPEKIERMNKKRTNILTQAVRDGISRNRHYETNLIRRAGTEDAPAPTEGGAVVTTATADEGELVQQHFAGILDDICKNTIFDVQGLEINHSNGGTFVWAAWNSGTARIVGEGEAIAASDLDLSKIKMNPETFAMRYDVTYEALMQTDNLVETIVRKALAEAMRRGINNLMVSTEKLPGSKGITGPLVAAYASAVSLGATPTFKAINKLKGKLLAKGLSVSPVWVLNPATACDLEATPKDAGSGIMIIEDGKMCGYPVFTNPAAAENVLALGDWSYQPANFTGETRLVVDPYTDADRNMVRFILHVSFATETLRPEAFIVGKLA